MCDLKTRKGQYGGVIPQFYGGLDGGLDADFCAAICSFCAGVILPLLMFGRSLF